MRPIAYYARKVLRTGIILLIAAFGLLLGAVGVVLRLFL